MRVFNVYNYYPICELIFTRYPYFRRIMRDEPIDIVDSEKTMLPKKEQKIIMEFNSVDEIDTLIDGLEKLKDDLKNDRPPIP